MKNKTLAYFTLVLFLFLQSISFSQLPEFLKPGEPFEYKPQYHSEKFRPDKIQKLQSVLIVRPYDVLNYDIFLDWYNILTTTGVTGDFRIYNGINSVKLRIDSNNINQLTFDAINIIIDSVISNEDIYRLNFSQSSETVKVNLLSPKLSGDIVELKIYFTYIGKDNGGLYLFPKGQYVGQGPPPKRDSIFVLERLAYTMSEPQDARKWVPCNDSPFDKAMVSYKIKVPKGFNVATNGLLDSSVTIKDSSFFWCSSKFPMATYLMTINASKFTSSSSKYFRISDPNIEVPVEYYVWDEDWTSDTTNGGAYNAEFSFRNTVKMMENYSKVFGEYPFEKYGMVAVQPFGFGGMEHQTMSTINRSWMRGYSESGIAHELAHQWLGDMITCATWFDIWINEGGATWSEAVWFESLYGKETYYQYMNQVAQRYKNEETIYEIPIYGVPINSIFVNPIYLLEYNKASWIYHMLREQLGDDVFFPALQDLFEQHKFKSLETIDFRNTLKELVPKSIINFDTFFDQWISKAGHPKIKIHSTTYDWGSGNSKVIIQLEQTQEGINVPNVFVTPIEFMFFKDSLLVETKTELFSNRKQEFELFLSFYPDSIAINTNKLLCDIEENLLSVKIIDKNISSNSNIYPNPARKGINAVFQVNIDSKNPISIKLYDLFGRSVETVFEGNIVAGNYEISVPTNNLSSGNYLIEYNVGNEKRIQKLIIVE